MFEFLQKWIIQVIVTVIFMILVDMILPDNNFKKYAKLITGLIIIIIMLTPLFKLFDSNIDWSQRIGDYIEDYQVEKTNLDIEKAKKENRRETIEAFKEKLVASMEQTIYKQTGEKYSINNIKINEDVSSYNFSEIEYMELLKSSSIGKIKAVDKVVIGNSVISKDEGIKDDRVLEVLKNEFNVNAKAVKFVK